ncbi:MAG: WG repeat-containing protein [Saprospiraceae bacterium]
MKIEYHPEMGKLCKTKISLLIILLSFGANSYCQQILIPYKKGNVYGFANESKKVIIEPKYDLVFPFDSSGFAIIIKDSLYGQINRSGEELIRCIFSSLEECKEERLFTEDENGVKKYVNLTKIGNNNQKPGRYFIKNLQTGEVTEFGKKAKIRIATKIQITLTFTMVHLGMVLVRFFCQTVL